MSTVDNEAVTLTSIFLNLVPVLIGGLLAAGGGLIGAYLSHKLNKDSEYNRLKREKLEQLANAAYRAVHWLDQHRENTLFNGTHSISLSPISEVEYLSKLYFKELNIEVAKLSLSVSNINVFIAQGNKHKSENNGFLPKNFAEDYAPLYNDLIHCLQELIEKISDIAGDL